MNRALAVGMLCLPGTGLTQDVHIVHCLAGCPAGAPRTNDLLIREIYALSNNAQAKFADWVAYRVTRETVGTSDALQRNWQDEELLKEAETLEEADYAGAFAALRTYRGHQAPLASFAGTLFSRVRNILSNIPAQKSALNQGPWVRLETAARCGVRVAGVLVVTGPVYDSDAEAMVLPGADKRHRVPTGYFKVVADDIGRATAFFFDQDADRGMDHCDGIVTLREVEAASGLDIFPREPDWPNGTIQSRLGC